MKKNGKKTSSKSITKRNTQLVDPKARGGSLENLDQEQDINIPRIKLLQPGSEEVVGLNMDSGNYYNKATNEEIDGGLQMIPMYLFKQRVLFDRETDEMSCRSENSIHCSFGLHETEKLKCSDCEESKWTKLKNGDSKAPPCSLSNNFLIYTPEDIQRIIKGEFVFPKVISFKKTAYQCSKDLISTCLYLGKDLYNFAFELSSVQKKKDKYTYYVPVINKYKEVDDKTFTALSKIFSQMKGLVQHVEIEVDKDEIPEVE